MQPIPIINVKKGESIYKVMRTPWLNDSQGPVMFKLLSKKCLNGEIEAAYVVERSGGYKTVIGRTTTKEDEFMTAANCFRQTIWKDFPDVDLAVEDVGPIDASAPPKDTSQYHAAKATKAGVFWIRVKKRLGL